MTNRSIIQFLHELRVLSYRLDVVRDEDVRNARVVALLVEVVETYFL